MRRRTEKQSVKRDRWVWLSLIPIGLGAWAPIVAGWRCRVWRWIALGLLWTGIEVTALVLSGSEHGQQTQSQNSTVGLLLIIAWAGGAVTSFAIRPSYDYLTTADLDPEVRSAARRLRPWRGSRPAPTERSTRWTVRYALSAYVVTFLVAGGLGLLLRYPLGLHIQVGVGVLLVDLCLLAALIPIRRRFGLSRQDIGLRATNGVGAIGLVLLSLLAYGAVIALWVAAIEPHGSAQKLSAATNPSTLNAILAVVALSASAPVVEEIFFRGLLYRSLRNRLPIVPAALVAGCLFGLVHITSYPLVTLPVKAAFGIIACLLYERTGSLLPGIALHSFVDASVVDVALSGNDDAVLLANGCLVVLIVLTVAVRRVRRPRATPRLEDSPAPIADPGEV